MERDVIAAKAIRERLSRADGGISSRAVAEAIWQFSSGLSHTTEHRRVTGGHVSGYGDDPATAPAGGISPSLGGGTSASIRGGGGGAITTESLVAQLRRLEHTLMPMVGASVGQQGGDLALAIKMNQIIELIEQLSFRLTPRR